ncbi:NAD(P)-dependent oxidoreductase [Virgisporangium ochraceum]|uniref:3-beta hydroxysteroid dehydrogenase n=2 Tax=Virgisporangium ochraceum TaxID=65505 RepID=A0A8J3ZYT3_9ACTN|nr:3-beta hydroxysteroid dehydrogenase [Virgisporangium ochraceum]
MRLMLTGATGNVGSRTLPALLAAGHDVRCLIPDTPAQRRAARRLPRDAELRWGDVRDAAAVRDACEGVEAVVHLAAVIPPTSEEQPDLAREVNVGGTVNVVAARPQRLLFASTLDVHGRTQDRPPPRRVDDPLVATDAYTAHKIECENLVRDSDLEWCILRLADVPVLGPRPPHPIMFEIGLDNRIESVHVADVATAITNALHTPAAWGRTLFIGGGPTCQLTYREFLTRMLAASGLPPLPDSAFSTAEYVTDWLDTVDSEALLQYQRHTFDDILTAVRAGLGWRRYLARLASPIVRASLLRMSPYYNSAQVQ